MLAMGVANTMKHKWIVAALSLFIWMGASAALGQVFEARVWIEGMT